MSVRNGLLFALPLALTLTLPVYGQGIMLIRNGTINPVTRDIIERGSLLIKDGRIVEIGRDIPPPGGAQVIDAAGKQVYPGLIAPWTAFGLTVFPSSTPGARDDTDEIGSSTPQMDPYDAFNVEDDCIEVARIDGITTALTVSGSQSPINGKAMAINLAGDFPAEMVLKRYAAQVFNTAARVQSGYPSTLPGVANLIREKLQQAQRYARKKSAGLVETDLEMEALVPVVEREVPALFVTTDEVTVRNALQIIGAFDLKGIIFARAGILKFAGQIAAEQIPVIWAGTMNFPTREQPFDLNFRTASALAEKGVCFAINENVWDPGSYFVRRLPFAAGLSVAHGLSEEEALRALTINTAKVLGIDDQVGSLEVGKIANILIADGSPIQVKTRIRAVIIEGRPIPMTSIQTRLRDEFGKKVERRLGRD